MDGTSGGVKLNRRSIMRTNKLAKPDGTGWPRIHVFLTRNQTCFDRPTASNSKSFREGCEGIDTVTAWILKFRY